ncbi:unnamed protein product, partial [Amoebophrya sp. A25]
FTPEGYITLERYHLRHESFQPRHKRRTSTPGGSRPGGSFLATSLFPSSGYSLASLFQMSGSLYDLLLQHNVLPNKRHEAAE